jgi:uncharacterized protein YbjQ (UPF0145 family)/DNA-directed RNA polymerase subunit N (RpoN/RPB10)
MKQCPNCHAEVYPDSIRCLSCGKEIPKIKPGQTCLSCGKASADLMLITDRYYCEDCALKRSAETVIATTTPSIDEYKIRKYISIEGVEIVIGTGIFSEFQGDVADILGRRSTEFERKLQNARLTSVARLKFIAFTKGADAIVAVDFNYTEFSGNRIGLIASGTLVKIDPA